ncbi:MAG TPA: hydroxymethylbilane synthase [Candidatus Limnocylindrales bacterium]|nr:hydroxymethylbilane synthase [Candidatus Limnocylindrales bacterium]
MPRPLLRLGTRGSALARRQAALVAAALEAHGIEVETVAVQTEGDRRRPETVWGEGAFVRAIEAALLDGRVDVAVHSAKDVPTDEPDGLLLAAFPRREDPRDALVGRVPGLRLADLPAGARVGTDSPRRTGFLRGLRPDLDFHPLHGNVDTRLRRLEEGETDALVLALAGLRRLGREQRAGEVFAPEVLPPAPGQGALAVQARSDDERTIALLRLIDHVETRAAVLAERAFLRAMGGGCRAPIGALARVEAGEVVLIGGAVGAAGPVVEEARGPVGAAEAVGLALGERSRAVRRAAGSRASGGNVAPACDGVPDVDGSRPRVLVTRAARDADGLLEALRARGLEPLLVPAIEIEPADPAPLEAALRQGGFDWLVVTSRPGARALADALGRIEGPADGSAHDRSGRPRIAAVGERTATTLAEQGRAADFVAAGGSAAALAGELPLRGGERVLLVRGDLADDELPRLLRQRSALVEALTAYRTRTAPATSAALLAAAVAGGPPAATIFTSGSTVRGLAALGEPETLAALRSAPAVCIGPRTAEAARAAGFTVAAVADERSVEALAGRVADLIDGGRP